MRNEHEEFVRRMLGIQREIGRETVPIPQRVREVVDFAEANMRAANMSDSMRMDILSVLVAFSAPAAWKPPAPVPTQPETPAVKTPEKKG